MVARGLALLVAASLVGVGACALLADIEDVPYRKMAIPDADGPETGPGAGKDAGDASLLDGSEDSACDRDHDGFRRPACGGDDCDDDDERHHPDAAFVTDPPPEGKDGDWNCDGTITFQFSTVATACLGTDPCAERSGFNVSVDCGRDGLYYECVPHGSNCDISAPITRRQGCR